MGRVELLHPGDAATRRMLAAPLDNWIVREAAIGDLAGEAPRSPLTPAGGTAAASFALDHGPFTHWERRVDPAPGADPDRSDMLRETIDFRVATPGFATPAGWLFGYALRRPLDQRDRAPFWAPTERFDERGARVFPLLVVAVMTAGYLGTLLSQTLTYVADDFGADRTAQGLVSSMTRFGALLSLVVVAVADRRGRRRMLVAAGIASAVFAASAALSPTIWFFGGAETLSRGLATAFAILIGIYAAEESPAGSRAWITSVLALFAGLASGMVLWLLPIADLSVGAWRFLFLVGLIAVPLIWRLGHRLPESRRFASLETPRGGMVEPAPITAAMRRRFAMLAAVSFGIAVFAAPASNFQNEYLRDERGFNARRITLYGTVTSTPIGVGVAIFGPLADRRGRRLIGAIGIIAGVVFGVIRYRLGGPLMWVAGTMGTIIGAAAIPALGVYGPEMFPTTRRGLANGLLTCVSVVGSVLGLSLVGYLAERWSFGQVFTVLAIVPLLAVIVIAWYPETARRSLEDLNPEDSLGQK